MIKIIIGIAFIVFIIWNRIRFREPLIFKDIISPKTLIITSILCVIIFSTLIIITYNKKYRSNEKSYINITMKKRQIVKILDIFQEYILAAPEYLYDITTEKIRLRWLIEKPASYFTAYFENYPQIFVIIFYYMPQIMVSSMFFLEICILQQRVYFIWSLNLLILFLLAKVIIFIFKKYSIRRLKHYELFLDVKENPQGMEKGFEIALKPPDHMPKDIPMSEIIQKYNYMCQFWFVYKCIYVFMCKINDFNNAYSFYIQMYCYFCFLIGWSYIFLYFII